MDNIQDETLLIPEDEGNIIDEAEHDDTVIPQRYGVSCYGADFDVDGLIKRLDKAELYIPDFQREYVWSLREASRFVESLLLGLPVPGVILAKEAETNKLFVIDGQQRLKTLQFYRHGVFNPKKSDEKQIVFKLKKVQEPFDGRKYGDLEDSDRILLDNSVIHATIVKQDFPEEDDTCIYHIFERLNNSGRRLFPHEIRQTIYHGSFIDELKRLNKEKSWRKIFGKPNKRLKDQELILRFFALLDDNKVYKRPMTEFLNKFVSKNRNPSDEKLQRYRNIFCSTIAMVNRQIGERAFRLPNALNAAFYDSFMVGLATRIEREPIDDERDIIEVYEELQKDDGYIEAISKSTSDNQSVEKRITLAIEALDDLK